MNNSNPISTKSKTLLFVVSFSYVYPFLLFGILSSFLPDDTVVRYVLTMIAALVIGAVALWAIQIEKIGIETIGFQKTKIQQAALIPLIEWLNFAAILLMVLLAKGEKIAPFLGEPSLILQQWLFVGIGEELLFRGYLLTSLIAVFSHIPGKWRKYLALFISNGIFATFHIPVVLYRTAGRGSMAEILSFIPAAFLAGLILSYFFLRTNNVLLAVIIHGSINAPLIGKEDDPMTSLIILFFIITEIWVFIQNRKSREHI